MKKKDVSILLATHNRAQLLGNTLEHISCQEALGGLKWEVIVIDNGSTDDTASVLERMKTRLPLIALYDPLPGKSRALNMALEIAQGELIVFTDDDVEPARGWISSLHAAAHRYRAYSIFCGPILPQYPNELPAWFREIFNNSKPFYESIAFAKFLLTTLEGPTDIIPFGPNFAVRAEDLMNMRFNNSIGPEREDYPMGEDTDLLLRLRENGKRIIYLPNASVQHVVRKEQINRQYLLRRAFRAGRGYARLGQYHSDYVVEPLWKIWFKLFLAWALYILGSVRSVGTRLKLQAEVYWLRGVLYESAIIAKEYGKS